MTTTEHSEPRVVRALLIVEGNTGRVGYPCTAEELREAGPDRVAEAMAWVVRQRGSTTAPVELRLECEDRTTT